MQVNKKRVSTDWIYKRTLNNIYELLERIYIKGDDTADHSFNEDGVNRFYKILILINKKSKVQRKIPFICNKIGNA